MNLRNLVKSSSIRPREVGFFFPLLGINEAASGVLCPILTFPEQTGVQKGTTEWLEGWICYVFIEAKGKSN